MIGVVDLASLTGTEPANDLFPATTDATWCTALGVPTLPAVGPGLLAHAHAPDEAMAIDALRHAVDVCSALIGDCAAGWER